MHHNLQRLDLNDEYGSEVIECFLDSLKHQYKSGEGNYICNVIEDYLLPVFLEISDKFDILGDYGI